MTEYDNWSYEKKVLVLAILFLLKECLNVR